LRSFSFSFSSSVMGLCIDLSASLSIKEGIMPVWMLYYQLCKMQAWYWRFPSILLLEQ
jgi:ABC-type uncharacterized transport system permease subunit